MPLHSTTGLLIHAPMSSTQQCARARSAMPGRSLELIHTMHHLLQEAARQAPDRLAGDQRFQPTAMTLLASQKIGPFQRVDVQS
ncbi:hypothetical protein ALP89_00883 [Pseudomonas syringae pv. persicae]|nr:hypothetical protein ALP89_00883 [Pseudomonas syringae pv. persicae]